MIYDPVSGKVILPKGNCNTWGGYVWASCGAQQVNKKTVDSLKDGETFSCPSSTTTTTPVTTTNTNTFNITASKTANNTIKVDYNIPASSGYKTCLITAGTSVDMLTISNGSVTTGNGMSS